MRLPGRARLAKRRGHLGGESGAGSPRCAAPRRSGLAVQVPPERRRRACCWLLPTSAAVAGLVLGLAAINLVLRSRGWYLSCLRAVGVY